MSRGLGDVYKRQLMGKALDLAEAQGEAVQEMMELSSPSFHVLDVYA